MVHGVVDVPGQKIGIVLSGILLTEFHFKNRHEENKILPGYGTIIYQLVAVSFFILGVNLVIFQWFSSRSISFSDNESRMIKIQNLYDLSINAAKK